MKIKPIGRFFPLDQFRNIVNDAHWEKIPPHWQAVIHQIILAYQKHLGEQLQAVYVRGSVVHGNVVDGFSDIDTFALVHSKTFLRWETAPFQLDTEQQLQQFFPFVRKVEMQLATYSANSFLQKNPNLAMLIQTQSLCVFGKDITSTLPYYQPNRSVCLNYQWLETDIHDFLKKLKRGIDKEDCQAMMKVIIRVGFELVIEQEKQFTVDLYPCYQVFATYFPEKEPMMKQALTWYLNPITEEKVLTAFIQNFGWWLVKTINREIEHF